MVFFEFSQKCLVQTGSETRIYQGRGKSAIFLDCRGKFFSFLEKITQGEDGNFFSLLFNFEAVQYDVVFICRAVAHVIAGN